MTNISPLSIQNSQKFVRINFSTVLFNLTGQTLNQVLGPSNHVVNPAFGPTAPLNFKMPIQNGITEIRVRHRISVMLGIASTGSVSFATIPVKLFGFNADGNAGTIAPEYDGMPINFQANSEFDDVYIPAKSLRQVTINNWQVSYATDMANLQNTTPVFIPSAAAVHFIIASYKLTIEMVK